MTKMKAVVCTKYGPPTVLRLKEIEKPIPKDHEILVRVHATTVSAADYRVRSFNVPTTFWLPAKMALGFRKPRKSILGMEISGRVEAVGKCVKTFNKGDDIFAATLQSFGGYAEYICLAEDSVVATKPTALDYRAAAAIPIGARTAWHYLKDFAEIKKGQKLLVYGASGSVGTYAIQLAKYFGAEVTAVCSTSNLSLVKSIGADKVIDYTKDDFTNKFENYDIIFVTVDKCPFTACKKALNKSGVYMNIGRPIPSFEMIWASLTSDIKVIVGKNVPESAETLFTLKSITEQGIIKPIIDRTYSLDQIVEAHHYADKGHKRGNLVITINE